MPANRLPSFRTIRSLARTKSVLAAVLLLVLILLALPQERSTQTLTGKVISVADGDTLTILDDANQKTRVRLFGIDAPEMGQAYGTQSKKLLSTLAFGKVATVEVKDVDQYGRAVGIVHIDSTICNTQMLRLGLAWHYRRYSKSAEFQALEDEARREKRGLWADPNPLPPWEYRKDKKK